MTGRLGFALSCLTGLPPSQLAQLAQTAERRGFDTVTLTESYVDVMPTAAAVAGETREVTIATSTANVGFRHPALLAMGAAAIDELSGGRFVLGLGVGTQWFDRRAVAATLERPLAALDEYVAILRRLWRAGPENSAGGEGALYRLDEFRIDFVPARPTIPIFLAAMGPGMLRLAGRIADGVFLGLTPLDAIPASVETVRSAAAEAGRNPGDVTIGMLIRVCVDDDLDLAREGIRTSLPLYLTFPGYARHWGALGYGAVVDAVQAAHARGEQGAAAAAIPDELVDRVSLYGPAERCQAGLDLFRAAGVDLPIVSTRTTGGPWLSALERAIDTLGPSLV